MAAHETQPYLLGHSKVEINRLDTQAMLVDPITRRLFREAGIGPGMRVLDIGCGAGAASQLAANLVGPHGSVTAVESDPTMLDVARTRLAGSPVRFVRGDLDDADLPASLPGPYDAVVGRFILIFGTPRSAWTPRSDRPRHRPGRSASNTTCHCTTRVNRSPRPVPPRLTSEELASEHAVRIHL